MGSQRLLGMPRVFFALGSAAVVSFMVLPADKAAGVVAVGLATTVLAGNYGNSVLGGVMGDFLGATICMTELAIYLALSADIPRLLASAEVIGWPATLRPLLQLIALVAAPQMYA